MFGSTKGRSRDLPRKLQRSTSLPTSTCTITFPMQEQQVPRRQQELVEQFPTQRPTNQSPQLCQRSNMSNKNGGRNSLAQGPYFQGRRQGGGGVQKEHKSYPSTNAPPPHLLSPPPAIEWVCPPGEKLLPTPMLTSARPANRTVIPNFRTTPTFSLVVTQVWQI